MLGVHAKQDLEAIDLGRDDLIVKAFDGSYSLRLALEKVDDAVRVKADHVALRSSRVDARLSFLIAPFRSSESCTVSLFHAPSNSITDLLRRRNRLMTAEKLSPLRFLAKRSLYTSCMIEIVFVAMDVCMCTCIYTFR